MGLPLDPWLTPLVHQTDQGGHGRPTDATLVQHPCHRFQDPSNFGCALQPSSSPQRYMLIVYGRAMYASD